MEVAKTFFSYSRADAEFALKLAKDLREAGANVWLDQLDIAPGLRWDTEIEKALQNAENMLVILSERAIASNNVMDEISYALEEGKRVIPIIVSECTIPFRIKRLQHIDFSKKYDDGIDHLLKALSLKKAETKETPSPPAEPGFNNDFDKEEDTLWQQTEKDNSLQSFQNYLQTFPTGKYKNEALFGIKLLEKISNERKNKEQILWDKACETNTVTSYQEYLAQTALGSYKTLAVKFIKQLEAENQKEFSNVDIIKNSGSSLPEPGSTNNNKVLYFILGGVVLLIFIIVIASNSGNRSSEADYTTKDTATFVPNDYMADSAVKAAADSSSTFPDAVADSTK